jgi:MoaA/NifB/PqqE/SkfB family radical SAM enzyme
MNTGPTIIQMSFDRTCNLKCPSCRVGLYVADKKKIERVNMTIKEIEDNFAKDLVWIYVTGSGDPFVSVGFRNFLRNFDSKKYPKLTNIHLHTNATMWDKDMWESMAPIHRYVKTCEISIDAATKETYENKTRIGGDWDVLIDNLKFINTIPNINSIKTSFVVQSNNYKEMVPFLDLMKTIFGKKVKVFFGKVNNWGTFNEEEFEVIKVWDESHKNYLDFIEEFNKVCLDDSVFHNMHEFVKINKSFI